MSTPAPSTPPRESPGPSPGFDDVGISAGSLVHLYPDEQTGHIFVSDPVLAERLMAERAALDRDRMDEVWDGILLMAPQPNIEHQDFGGELEFIFRTVLPAAGGGKVYGEINVSDRDKGCTKNFRVPDAYVYLAGKSARNCKTHMLGGPDLAVEILSHRDPAREKLDFYAAIGTREVLLIDREPWSLELYRLANGRLRLIGISTADRPDPLTIETLPLVLRLLPGENRPTLEIARVGGEQTWRIGPTP